MFANWTNGYTVCVFYIKLQNIFSLKSAQKNCLRAVRARIKRGTT